MQGKATRTVAYAEKIGTFICSNNILGSGFFWSEDKVKKFGCPAVLQLRFVGDVYAIHEIAIQRFSPSLQRVPLNMSGMFELCHDIRSVNVSKYKCARRQETRRDDFNIISFHFK